MNHAVIHLTYVCKQYIPVLELGKCLLLLHLTKPSVRNWQAAHKTTVSSALPYIDFPKRDTDMAWQTKHKYMHTCIPFIKRQC
jgi:hypothetical protein